MPGFKKDSFNIASIVKHYEELQILMEKQPLDLLCINESRLDETISDGEIKLSGYNLIRRELEKKRGFVFIYETQSTLKDVQIWRMAILKC